MNIKDIKEDIIISPTVIKHWEYKLERSICILLKSGYNLEDLIEKIKTIALIENEESN